MTEATSKTGIFFIVDDYHGCGWYRCHVPGMELQRRGYRVTLNDGITPQQVDASDVIVFQRQWRPVALQAMQYAKQTGKLTVFELDDDLWNLHPSNPGYKAWSRPRMIGGLEAMLRLADVVTTTTPALADQLRRFNGNIRILPNMLPGEHWRVERVRPAGYDRVAVGWAGSSTRGRDLEIVKDIVLQLLARYPRMDFLVAGDDSNMVFPPHERIRQLRPVKIEQYPRLIAEFDVGIAPVVDSRFNQAKSDLKILEYGILGVPCVASNVEAYAHSVENGENGFLAKNDKQWLKYLERLIEQPELRETVGSSAKEFAESRTIERNVQLWERAYGLDGGAKGAAS
jgi:glycosyltransferase involved in cell wall biosynthesis